MENVGLEQFDFEDWDEPGRTLRGPARLYLPGNECVYQIVGYEPVPTPPPTEPAAGPAGDEPVEGFRRPLAPPATDPPPASTPPATPAPTPPVTTTTVPGGDHPAHRADPDDDPSAAANLWSGGERHYHPT